MGRYLLRTLLAIIILVLTLPISAICAPPQPGTHPGPHVNITNDALAVEVTKQLPFCPCFSTDEINSFLGNSEVSLCEDDRVVGTSGIGVTTIVTNTLDSTQKSVSVEGISDECALSWSCKMVVVISGSPAEVVLDYFDIGFTNAMACRLAIINSNGWTQCP
jgi:hypothetical protein